MKPRNYFVFVLLLLPLFVFAGSDLLKAQTAADVFGQSSVVISDPAKSQPEASTAPSGMGGSFSGTVRAIPGLNIRNGPWGAIIGSFGNGASVTVIGQEGEWYKVSYNGTVGYCHSAYITQSSTPAASAARGGTVNAVPGLNVRTGPWGSIVGSFANGARVSILGQEGEWYRVSYNGAVGYCHSAYINADSASSTAPAQPASTPATSAGYVTADVLNVRSAPWGSILTTFNYGTKIDIVGKEGDWYRVSWNGRIVYCHASYVSSSKPSSGTTTPVTPAAGANGKVVLPVPQQCQGYVKCPYPWSACGPTSLGMALAYHNKQNAGALASTLWNTCGSTGAAGTSHAGMLTGARANGFPNAKWHYSVGLSWVREQIKAGKPVIANVYNHYVVITGVDDSGNIYYNDPAKDPVPQVRSFDSFSAWWNGGGCYHAAMTLN